MRKNLIVLLFLALFGRQLQFLIIAVQDAAKSFDHQFVVGALR